MSNAANPHWARWVFASISKHFDASRDGVPLFIEGQHRSTSKEKEYFELRIDGPKIRKLSHKHYWLRVEVNVLISVAFSDESYHRLHTLAGQMQAAFTRIPVYKLGNTPVVDDQSFVGCLVLLQGGPGRDDLELNHFGRVGIGDALVQATVEGHYRMTLDSTA